MTQEEFARRVVEMQDTLYRVSASILPQQCDREDAVQSAIEKALRKRDRLRRDEAMRAWMTRILVNECYTLLRGRRRETLCDDFTQWEMATDASPDLRTFFASLDDKYRLPMVLRYVEGYSVEEIAGILRIPRGTVKSRLHRGRTEIRQELDAQEVLV